MALSAVLLSACVTTSETSTPSPSADGTPNSTETPSNEISPVATSTYTASSEGTNLRFSIISLERISEEMVVLSIAIKNEGFEDAYVIFSLSNVNGQQSTPDGVSLVDTVNQKRYMPLKLTDGKTCHCYSWNGKELLASGDSINAWVAFPSPPPEVDKVAVTTPVTPDFLDIPIIEATGTKEEIAQTPVGEPQILDLRAFQDDIESGTSRADSSEENQVILSSDVLFELNESDLTPEAEEILKGVAEEIDTSSATTVHIDGYTDNTGDDSINIPLSEARAESVRQALEELVTRDGIQFETAGHGSNDPVGNNDTEEGRRKNRRVTVTFAK